MNQFGVVIVTYNSAKVIGNCLDACLDGSGVPAGLIVVVDNASEDETLREVGLWPGVRVIANAANRGFAAAVNQGAACLDTPFILLLNPDSCPVCGLALLQEACAASGVGAAGGKLVSYDGAVQSGFMVRRLPTAASLSLEVLGINRAWPGNPVNRRYRALDLDENAASDAEQPAGAFLMFRREAWSAIGGFDEQFEPIWFEDVDFCKRLRDAGWRIRYVPGAVARHLGAHSAGKVSWECRQLYWYSSLLRYAAKHLPRKLRWPVCPAVILASLPRMLAGVVVRRSLRPVLVFGKIVGLAVAGLVSGKIVRSRDSARMNAAVG